MTDAFLGDIIENPDDDAPRLIYADWLEDNGDPERAEFIRLQCALAALSPYRPRPAEMVKREAELLERHREKWAGRLAEYFTECNFHRGFIEAVRVPLGRLLANPSAAFDRHPIRMVASHLATADEVRRMARMPQLARLRVLTLSSSMREATFRSLIESRFLTGLRGLSVHDSPLGMEGLQALLDSEVLPRLTHLDLSSTSIGLDGVNALTTSPKSQSLIALNLRGNNLAIGALRQMDASASMKNLRRLGIWFNRLRDNGVEGFLRLPLFARLNHLDIGYNYLTQRGATAMANSPALKSLRSLWMGVDRLDDGMLALARSPHLHPEANLAFWFCDYFSDEARREAEEALGARVQFDRGQGLPERDPCVGWPLWRPPAE